MQISNLSKAKLPLYANQRGIHMIYNKERFFYDFERRHDIADQRELRL